MSFASKGWAVKMQIAQDVFGDPNVASEKKMSALGADPHFIQGPPFLVWIRLPENVQFAAVGLRESHALKYTAAPSVCESEMHKK
jgi:hypothetical protein